MPPRMRGRNRYLSEEEKKNRPKLTKALALRILSYLKPYRAQMLMVLICILISCILGVIPSILVGRIIDGGLYGRDFRLLINLVLLSFGVLLLSQVVGIVEVILTTRVGQFITYDMRNKMFAHLQTMGHRFFTSNRQGEVITRMTEDISGVQAVIANTLVNIIGNMVTVLVVLVTLFKTNWILALAGVLTAPLLALPTRLVGKRRWKLAEETQKQRDHANQILNESLSVSGQLLVKLFTNEQKEYEAYKKVNLESTRLAIRDRLVGMWFWRAFGVLRGSVPLIIYVIAGMVMLRYGNGNLSVGDVTVLITLISRLYGPVESLLNIQTDIIRSMALFTRIFEYFDMKPDVENPENGYRPEVVRGDLAFENVSFSYSEDKPLLQGIHFRVNAGKMIAIVGASGGGKSTLVNLIPRLFDVEDGSLTLDGVDVRQWDLYALRRQIAMVTQETYLFNDTVRANLLYAKADATEEELIAACKDAQIHDLICSMPQGYDTPVGNRGFKLSGGEKQRLSIARAILKDPRVLILDEATSSLDSISENLIQKAIGPLLKGRTAIVIAHRLTTVLAADEILVMDRGRIVERGRHSALVEQNGVYRRLYETQFREALRDHDQRRTKEEKHGI